MIIHVVRHGITHHNKIKLINGQNIDEGLEPEGFIQTEEAATNISSHVVKIYASDMQRTRQTADTINKKLNLPISYHPEIREVHFGSFSGTSWDDIEKEHGTAPRESYFAVTYDYTPHGGESADIVKDRVRKLVEEVKSAHQDHEEVVIVTHGGIVRVFYDLYAPDKSRPHNIDNCSIHQFVI